MLLKILGIKACVFFFDKLNFLSHFKTCLNTSDVTAGMHIVCCREVYLLTKNNKNLSNPFYCTIIKIIFKEDQSLPSPCAQEIATSLAQSQFP